jgi:hypothetical protein
MTRMPLPGVIATCVVASCAYAGVVRLGALLSLVLPAVVITGVVAASVVRRPLTGLLAVALTSLATAEVVNIISGEFQGPAARATAAGAFLTGIAVILAKGRHSAGFVIAVTGIVCSAMALGGGGQVRTVALATAISATLSLLAVERHRTGDSRTAGIALAGVFAVLVVLAGAAGALVLQSHSNTRPARIPFPELAQNRPPAVPGLLAVRRGAAPAAAVPSAARPADHPHRGGVLRLLVAGLAAVLVGLVLLTVGRLAWARLSWRRLRHRRAGGEPADRVTGAWLFAIARLAALGEAVAPSASPDVISRSAADPDLRQLGTLVEQNVFAPTVDVPPATAAAAWAHADNALRSVRARSDRRTRLRTAWRIP